VEKYYQTEEGKKKKQELNARRKQGGPPIAEPTLPPPVQKPKRERLLGYYQWILLAVDGRQLEWAEIEILVNRIREELRQRGLPDFEKINKVPDG
jgi:hypothetical protein